MCYNCHERLQLHYNKWHVTSEDNSSNLLSDARLMDAARVRGPLNSSAGKIINEIYYARSCSATKRPFIPSSFIEETLCTSVTLMIFDYFHPCMGYFSPPSKRRAYRSKSKSLSKELRCLDDNIAVRLAQFFRRACIRRCNKAIAPNLPSKMRDTRIFPGS